MARTKPDDEIEFGSDSFLDVVANIVGILIILIVVAGIKAGAAPVTAERVAEFLRKHASKPPARATEPAPAAPHVIPPSPDLIRKVDGLKAELAALKSDAQTSASQIDQTAHEEDDVKQRIADLKQALGSESAGLNSQEQALVDARSRLEHEKTGLMQLEVDVQNAEKVKPDIKTIKHTLTPLSREIQGKEIHFRLLDNRVVYLPIDELMERLRPHVAHQRDRLMRDGVQRGQVGPFAGFRMDYVLEAHRLSVVDELRRGTSMTIGVSDWRLVPEPDLATESGDDALKDGSDFLRALRRADPDTTITMWVYPDSFDLYRRLQEFAHKENLTVAARPLPFGIPIAGSPHGSRSSGQ